MTADNSQSFKYKATLVGKTANVVNNTNSSVRNTRVVVSLSHLSNFWRTLEMPVINSKIHLELIWIEDCILSKFKITNAKLHVYTLSTKDNVNLTKELNIGPVYWNNYNSIPAKVVNQGTNIYELLSTSFQGVKRLFVIVYAIAANAANNKAGIKHNKKYFLPRQKIENYDVLIDGKKIYDQPINDLIKQYDEVRKRSTEQGADYTAGC